MATEALHITHLFEGGWATDFGSSSPVSPQGRGKFSTIGVPFLTEAENLIYNLIGIQKAPGAAKLNSSALESGATIMGIFDAWLSGTSGAPAQHRIIHVSTTIKKDDADGSFSNLFTGLESGKTPSYALLNDIVIMTSDSTTDVPKSWDGSTAQNLAGSPPNFAFCEVHKDRVWAAGNASAPSRLYYSAFVNPEDWAGTGSGFIEIDPDDGDIITGLASHRGELIVFKGPHHGSIHRLVGSAPTGSDPFRKPDAPWIKGIGCVWHNTIFRFSNDLGFVWADGSINSLSAVAEFGDFREVALSRPISDYLREKVNFAQLRKAWAADWRDRGFALIALPVDGATENTQILLMDYKGSQTRWASWPDFAGLAGGALAQVLDPDDSRRKIVMGGGNDGFVWKFGQSTRVIDTATSIEMKATTPYLSYGSPVELKELDGIVLAIVPKNSGDIEFSWRLDGPTASNTLRTKNISQSGSDVLGTVANASNFTLGTSTLGGSEFATLMSRLEPEGGQARSIQYRFRNDTAAEDVDLRYFVARMNATGVISWEN